MDDLETKYKKFLETPLPTINRKKILGIDLVQLINNSTKVISRYYLLRGHLNQQDFELIQSCSHKLKKVYREFDGLTSQYLAILLNILNRIIDSFNWTNRIVDKKKRSHWRIGEIIIKR